MKSPKFHIAYVLYVYDDFVDARAMLDAFFTTTDWTEEMVKNDLEVTVFYRFHQDEQFKLNGVNYYFFKDNLPPRLKFWQNAKRFSQQVTKVIQSTSINFLHLHNPNNVISNRYLRDLNPDLPSIIQDHSGVYNSKYRWLHKRYLADIGGLVFAAKGQEINYVSNKIVRQDQCHFVMENSSRFKFEERAIARKKTNMKGSPVFLWVGNLNKNKDPLTVLHAFDKILEQKLEARLYMVYRFNDMEKEIRNVINNSTRLSKSVQLLGAKKREDLAAIYNSADYFISASHKEGSGYALIEAMSCGVIPIVTDIPSFVELTKNGAIGKLWEKGDKNDLIYKVFHILEVPNHQELAHRKLTAQTTTEVLNHFNRHFSFDAIILRMRHVYQIVSDQKSV